MKPLTFKDYKSLFFNGCLIKTALIALVPIGLIFFIMFSEEDIYDLKLKFSNTKEIDGFVNSWEETSTSVNDNMMVHYFFGYSVDNELFRNQSYGTTDLAIDQKITIEYLVDDPAISRIKGMDNTIGGLIPLFIFGIPLLLLLFLIVKQLFTTIKIGGIITKGELVTIDLIGSSPTNVKINNRPQHKIEYSYHINGKNHTKFFKTTTPKKFKSNEKALVNRDFPNKIVLFKTLPKDIQKLLKKKK